MKKIILNFFLILLFSGCSSPIDDSNPKNASSINPPNWVQGTWLLEDSNLTSGYRFTNDDFCSVLLSGQNCFKESIRLINNSGAITNVKEVITDNSYSIEITLGSQVITYNFKKVSLTQIEWINDPLGDLIETIYTKQ